VQGWVVVNMVINRQVSYMIGDFWLAEQLLASQGGLCVVECVRFDFPFSAHGPPNLSWWETPVVFSDLDQHDGPSCLRAYCLPAGKRRVIKMAMNFGGRHLQKHGRGSVSC